VVVCLCGSCGFLCVMTAEGVCACVTVALSVEEDRMQWMMCVCVVLLTRVSVIGIVRKYVSTKIRHTHKEHYLGLANRR
jgi:hypothetical protein